MSHDKQDKTYAESRSRLGSMSFGEIRKYIGVDVNPDIMSDESGTPTNSEAGNESGVSNSRNNTK